MFSNSSMKICKITRLAHQLSSIGVQLESVHIDRHWTMHHVNCFHSKDDQINSTECTVGMQPFSVRFQSFSGKNKS